ncbi:MAG TPA: PKD domain-containing protein, partial [Gemmatimonadales bacterium]
MKTSHLRLLVLSLLMLGGCGGGEQLILPGDGQPTAIEVLEGDGQSGRVGEPLAEAVVVLVTDSRGRPVEGAPVAFEFGGAGAGADVIPEATETNSEGQAEAQLVLGTTIGRQTGRARVVTDEGRQPIVTTFSATALSESANSMAAVAGEDQTGHVGQPLDDRLVVEVTDGFGNPVPDVQINWSAVGGGSVSQATVRTGEDGRARVERVLGPAVGVQTTVATSEGLAGSPVVFTHTAIAGNASRLVIESGNEQTAAAGTAVPNELVVRLVDADGNGVSGTGLSWVVATGGGSASPENTATDGNGRATTRWTLGETLGEQRIDAVVSGVGFISFKATATAGAPAALSISTQPSSSAGNGVPFDRQPVIQLRDSRGNPTGAAGVQVRVSLGTGGGELLGTLVQSTDGNGRAVFTDLAITGDAGIRTLFFSAEGYAGVTSTPINVGPPANRFPTASFTVSCQSLSCSFTDGSSDPDGNIVGYSWNFGDGSGANERNPSHVYAGAGTYQVALTVTDDEGATNSTAQTITVNGPPPPQNRAPDADYNWNCEGLTCQFTDASTDSDGNVVSWSWNFGGTGSSNERNPAHTFPGPGEYQVTLTVTDNLGGTDESTAGVDVEAPPPPNQPPTVEFTWQCDELDCEFDGQSDDPDG